MKVYKQKPYHLVPLLLGALILFLLVTEMFRRSGKQTATSRSNNHFTCPKIVMPKFMPRTFDKSSIWLSNANNPRVQNLFQTLEGTQMTGNPHQDTQLLLNPGTIIFFPN